MIVIRIFKFKIQNYSEDSRLLRYQFIFDCCKIKSIKVSRDDRDMLSIASKINDNLFDSILYYCDLEICIYAFARYRNLQIQSKLVSRFSVFVLINDICILRAVNALQINNNYYLYVDNFSLGLPNTKIQCQFKNSLLRFMYVNGLP